VAAPLQVAQLVLVLLRFYRQFASIKFTHRPKISIFTPQGRLVAPIRVKLALLRGT